MNLWVRLFFFFCRALCSKDSSALYDRRAISFRVMPWDCDTNWHLTNSRYLSFMDLGRLDFFYYTGLWKWRSNFSASPILQSVEISFIRPIMPGMVTWVHTRLLGVDEKYCYIQQQFTVQGQLVADARVRAVLCNGYGEIWPTDILQDRNIPSQPPRSIEQWKIYLALKTEESSHF
jgi:acyl-CoA thioesterase FadM